MTDVRSLKANASTTDTARANNVDRGILKKNSFKIIAAEIDPNLPSILLIVDAVSCPYGALNSENMKRFIMSVAENIYLTRPYRPVPIYLFFGWELRPILVHDVISNPS